MINVLLHYGEVCFYEDARKLSDERSFFLNDRLEIIQDIFRSLYKREAFVVDQVFNFFYELEELLKWSPSSSMHRTDDTIIFSLRGIQDFYILIKESLMLVILEFMMKI